MKYVIIGNSAAAIGAIEGIRQYDKKGDICVISDENHHVYSRPLISYLLCSKTNEQKMKYRADSFYKDNACKTYLGCRVEKIDSQNKRVELNDKTVIDYDKLLVATGSRAFVPVTEGYENVKDKFTFMTIDDAKALNSALSKDKNVLVIGAGLIGLKCAEGIYEKCKSITVVDLADKILANVLNDKASLMMRNHLEKKGIKIITGVKVDRYDTNKAYLSDESTVDFDILVSAAGVIPNKELLIEAGCACERGVVINDRCETSIKDIYAAGDVSLSFDITSQNTKIIAIMPNAYRQGECAGNNMAGEDKIFCDAFPMNATGLLGMHMITAGSYIGECYEKKTENTYKALYYKDDMLKGFILIGDVARAGIYTSLIRDKKRLSEIDFTLIEEKPQLMAFERKERAMLINRGF